MKKMDMGTTKISRLVISMALPSMISMLIQSLYNIIDSLFVSRIGQDAFSAVSILYPIQNILMSVAVGLGVGLGSYISRVLGAGEKDKAYRACTIGMCMSVLHYVIILILGVLFLRPFVNMFTDSQTVVRQCMSYGLIVIIFSFGQNMHITLEKIFQATGKMVISMSLQAAGCIVNIILDPLLIFGIGPFPQLGVAGAAIATVIGQMTSCAGAVILFAMGKSTLKAGKISRGSAIVATAGRIYQVGLPSMLVMALPSILVSGLNSILKNLSDMGVAVFGMYYKLQTFVYMPSSGLVQGLRPVIGYNYGAGNFKREKQAFRTAMVIAGVIMLVGTILFLAVPQPFLRIFNAKPQQLAQGSQMLRIICISFIPSVVGIIAAAEFEAVGKGLSSLIITLLRQLVITLPLAYAASRFMGMTGVWIAFPVAEITAAVAAGIMVMREFRHRDIR